ncbi:signal recognition particle-docking protein FtsY [Levilactobacillus yonginensis]|uniref:signal recognition particle-docking protein FtsY n=1 Tax=Levilactobacillus yonginensis TaxID=1054041 RepID=UPI000F793ECB|nr:signal recognition particle-docking protein FtsY [Levilactobacillus yonginensis]
MGLFDIFRRRAKKEPESQASEAPVETPTSATPVESSAASDAGMTPASATPSSAETGQAGSADDEASSEAVSAQVAPVSSVMATSEAPATSMAATEPASVAEAPAEASVPAASEAAVSSTASSVDDPATDEVGSTTEDAVTSEAPTEEPVSSAAPVESQPVEDSPVDKVAEKAPATKTVDSETSEPAEKTDEQLYDKGLEKTRKTFGERLNALLANFRHVDEGFFDDLEETLIGADVGFDMAVKLSDELRDEVKLQNAKKSADVQNVVVEKLVEIYDAAGNDESTALNVASSGPTVILFVGVNGVGKTTTIGKMANRYHQDGKKVLLAAADTFRAGATEQLDVWAKRADVDIVTGKPQSDPAAVVFDAVKKAKEEDYDILFVDTAGRLQNKVNLMNELAKMKRIITREIPDAPHEVLLVLDATTGQNALTQAKLFKESTDVTGIVLTKLDGTARGGIVLAIRNELHVPVKFIGLGEQISDLRPFDPNEFVYGLFKGLIDVKALEK